MAHSLKARASAACIMIAACVASAGAGIINGDFELGDTGFTSAYGTNDIWAESQYRVVQSDTIHALWVDFPDHTLGDGQGHFMVVNGSTAATGAAWSQLVSVEPDTEYSLSAFFASVYPASPAWVEFRIDGALLSSFSAPVDVAQWSQRNATFNSGERTSIELSIWDTNQLAFGNDYAIDDIRLSSVPSPGATSLVALAGFIGLRRRR